METLNEDSGSMEMEDLLAPAINYAEEGFQADKHLVDRLGKGSYRMDVEGLTDFFPDGQIIEVNDTIQQPDLADTLRLIQEGGSDAFYAEIGRASCREGVGTTAGEETVEIQKQ